MTPKNTYTIVGTGAVGGYYGALLQRAGHDVRFLLNRDYEHVLENGLVIESRNGDFCLPSVHAFSSADQVPRSDVVIVALKTTANHLLPEILPRLLCRHGVVLTLQNGLGSEAAIAESIGADRILGGLCFLCSSKIAPGHIRHLDYGLITIGEYTPDGVPAGVTPRMKTIGKEMETAGIPIRLIEDLMLARWKKLVWNIPFNGMSVIHDLLTDELVRREDTRNRCRIMMDEVAAAAEVCARPIEQAFINKMMTDTEKMRPYAPSMKLDYDRGNPMEIESIYGNPLRLAKRAGVLMPETERLYDQLKEKQPTV
ncbi:MAG: putative 2-dehydropantoate 2-reductase [Pontiellaceae bacterium]|nr:putative 2-dehydropantoate 2-reductase [Pontiellaceae bacterium]MBN2784418.1 putative 2-dehydropantoate 2-reductase [Pontiellaceae bacterium]